MQKTTARPLWHRKYARTGRASRESEPDRPVPRSKPWRFRVRIKIGKRASRSIHQKKRGS